MSWFIRFAVTVGLPIVLGACVAVSLSACAGCDLETGGNGPFGIRCVSDGSW